MSGREAENSHHDEKNYAFDGLDEHSWDQKDDAEDQLRFGDDE